MAGSSELLRRQNAEKLQLERNLAKEEQEALERVTAEQNIKRQRLIEEMGDKLSNKLAGK